MMSIFLLVDYVDWISQAGGGTLRAPTGCSPQDCGRLLAVDYSLKNTSSFFCVLLVDWSTLTDETSGGTLSAPTGCSPRDYGRMFAFGRSLRNAMIFPYSLGSELSLTSVDWFFVEIL